MKGYIFDENLPRRIRFQPDLPYLHVSDLAESLGDSDIWAYALENDYSIINKDSDFWKRIIDTPNHPKIIQLRLGNMRRNDFHNFLSKHWKQISDYIKSHKMIFVYNDTIEISG